MEKGDLVKFGTNKAKIIGKSMKGGQIRYKIRQLDDWGTIVNNIHERELTKIKS
jgi:hypothetical protein|nr:MAG TPA: hypothetical protein [Bacteriophage sp.]